MATCEMCGTTFEVRFGRGHNNRVCCYACSVRPGYRDKRYRNKHLKRYGLTTYTFDQMVNDQAGCCKICDAELKLTNGTPQRGLKRSGHETCVDHDHATGRVRGILCFHCNTALGHVQDNPARLYSMIRYLEQHNEPD